MALTRRAFIERLTVGGIITLITKELPAFEPNRTYFIPKGDLTLYRPNHMAGYGHIITMTEQAFRHDAWNGINYDKTPVTVLHNGRMLSRGELLAIEMEILQLKSRELN